MVTVLSFYWFKKSFYKNVNICQSLWHRHLREWQFQALVLQQQPFSLVTAAPAEGEMALAPCFPPFTVNLPALERAALCCSKAGSRRECERCVTSDLLFWRTGTSPEPFTREPGAFPFFSCTSIKHSLVLFVHHLVFRDSERVSP